MSEYPNLKPIFASSTMNIRLFENIIKFSNNIVYDYVDLGDELLWKSYKNFLKNTKNYTNELSTYWDNLQHFLDEEINKINHKESHLTVNHCGIFFRDEKHPSVQWIVEFEGDLINKINIYENIIEKETLEYPLYSLYLFGKEFRIVDVNTSLYYEINPNRRILEYFGKTGDVLDGYEKISFLKSN